MDLKYIQNNSWTQISAGVKLPEKSCFLGIILLRKEGFLDLKLDKDSLYKILKHVLNTKYLQT